MRRGGTWKRLFSGAVSLTLAAIIAALVPAAASAAPPPTTHTLLVSLQSNRSSATPLPGAALSTPAYVFADPSTSIKEARFYLDGVLKFTDSKSPFDFQGGTSLANPFDFGTLAAGTHTIRADLTLTKGTESVSATFTCPPPPPPPTVVANPSSLPLTAGAGAGASGTVAISLSNGSTATASASSNQSWLTGTLAAPSAPTTLTVVATASTLAPGTYTGTITVAATGATSAAVTVTFTVTAVTYANLVSTSIDRSNPVSLNGYAATGNIYAFVDPAQGITNVRFFVDDAARAGAPYSTDAIAPYDLAGTGASGANPFVTTTLANGSHTVTAEVNRTYGGSQVVTSTFQVQNAPPPPPVLVSASPTRSSPVPLTGQELTGLQYIFVAEGAGIVGVDFFLDDPTMAGTPFRVEGNPPWDMGGTAPDGTANGVNTGAMTRSVHQVTARVRRSDGTTEIRNGTFGVGLSCGPVPCSGVKIIAPYTLEFDSNRGGILDRNGFGTGFTYLDPPATGSGYTPSLLNTDTAAGALRITTTAGLNSGNANSLVNAVGVGFDGPGGLTIVKTTLIDIPAGTGSFEQGGLWFGTDQDHYVKLDVISTAAGPRVEMAYEHDAAYVAKFQASLPTLTGHQVTLQFQANPVGRSVTGSYSLDGAPLVTVGTVTVDGALFSFDGAGIPPEIGTRSFVGVYGSHRYGPSPVTFSFANFTLEEVATGIDRQLSFARHSYSSVSMPTSMVWGPDNRLYVTELFGRIHALTYDASWNVVNDQVITAVSDRLTLGVAVDPLSTPSNVILWVAHSNPDVFAGAIDSGIVSKLTGPTWTRQDVITGLPRAYSNHATNSLHFGPDGKLYIAQGGNTGAGAANNANTEFADRAEEPLSAALLVADVRNTSLDFSCANTVDYTGPPQCNGVTVFASGLRNMYDFVFHSNGRIYGPDNGLGIQGSFPPTPTPPCKAFGDATPWTQGGNDPGVQPDRLQILQQGAYYGHPNPSRDECVFFDGHYQNAAPLPNFHPEMLILGNNLSTNGIVEYKGSAFCGLLDHDLLLANYSVGDDITRVHLSADGSQALEMESIAGGFRDPLPLATGPNGVLFVGEFGGSAVTTLVPQDQGCWSPGPSEPTALLDSGGTALNGQLYVVGGKTATAHVSTMYVFNPSTSAWTSRPSMPGIAVENPSVVAYNSKLWVFGGSTDAFSGAVGQAEVYDPVANSWSTLPSMPTPWGGATAQVVNGKFWVVGGMANDGSSLATVEIYDPVNRTWTTGPPMATRRDNPGSALLNGRLYVFGGRTRDADGTELNGTLTSVEMYDPATGVWSARAPMPTGRRTMVVGLLRGRAQLIGGERAPDGSAFAANEEYDPLTDTWQILTPITTARHGAVAGTIGTSLYVVGGGPIGGTSFTAVNEIFVFGG